MFKISRLVKSAKRDDAIPEPALRIQQPDFGRGKEPQPRRSLRPLHLATVSYHDNCRQIFGHISGFIPRHRIEVEVRSWGNNSRTKTGLPPSSAATMRSPRLGERCQAPSTTRSPFDRCSINDVRSTAALREGRSLDRQRIARCFSSGSNAALAARPSRDRPDPVLSSRRLLNALANEARRRRLTLRCPAASRYWPSSSPPSEKSAPSGRGSY